MQCNLRHSIKFSPFCKTTDLESLVLSVLTAIFPREPGLAGYPLNSPPFIPELRILLGQA